MTLKNNSAPVVSDFELWASFYSHLWTKTGVTVRKRPIWVKFDFFRPVTLKFDRWPKATRPPPLLAYFELYASNQSHWWIQTGVTVRKRPVCVKIGDFFFPCDLEIWQITVKHNEVPLLCYFKLCASFRSHMWIQTGLTVRKRPNWVLTSVTLTFDLWPWSLAWTSLLSMVISPENFMMIRWQEHIEKGVTDKPAEGRTDRRTDMEGCY